MDALPLLIAFMAAATLLSLTPGVDTAIVLQAALREGRRPAVWAAAGVALGCLAWGGAVALGLGLLLQASQGAYRAVQWAGAAYLIWMGLRLLWRPRRSLDAGPKEAPSVQAPMPAAARALSDARAAAAAAFRRGLATNLLNPKVGVFYVSFLPQFVPAGVGVAAYTFFLAGLHVLISLAWFALLIAATAPLARWLKHPRALAWMDRLTGGVFIALGLKLGASSAA